MIHLPHLTSVRHPRMPISERAAIFSPFAALTGHAGAIAETARLTDQKMELDEDTKAELDRRQAVLLEHIAEQPEITVTWFQPDERKDGGAYLTAAGRLRKLNAIQRLLVLTDGTEIPLDDVAGIESKSRNKRKTGVSRNGNASQVVRSRFSLLEITGARRRKGEGYEHPKAHRLQCHVCCTGSSHGNDHATGRAILRDWTSCLCQSGEGCSGGRFRVSAGSIPEGLWFLPSESSPDAGVLPRL